MTTELLLGAGAHGPSPVLPAVFALAGLAALWSGLNWAFDVRGITTRRAENIRRRTAGTHALMGQLDGSSTFFSQPWYLRMLGGFMAFAGLVLLIAAYALWHLN